MAEQDLLWISTLLAIHAVGHLSAVIARISLGSSCQRITQLVFFLSLVLVGGLTVVTLGCSPGCWLASGVTFALMVLTVTCDFSHAGRPATR